MDSMSEPFAFDASKSGKATSFDAKVTSFDAKVMTIEPVGSQGGDVAGAAKVADIEGAFSVGRFSSASRCRSEARLSLVTSCTSLAQAGEAAQVTEDQPLSRAKVFGIILGPALFFAVWGLLALAQPSGLQPAAFKLAGLTCWIATWWTLEALPIGVTSLLPLAIFPLLGVATREDVLGSYSKDTCWLFFGGVQLAFGVEKCGLHRRFTQAVLRQMSLRPPFVVLGFMLAVGVLSMFMSNTCTTVMAMPLALGIMGTFDDDENLSVPLGRALMLGTAYSASVGGMGSLIGTGTNVVLAATAETFDFKVSFGDWFMFAAPLSLLLLILIWLYLVIVNRLPWQHLGAEHPLREELRVDLGPMSMAEQLVAMIFAATVIAWTTKDIVADNLGDLKSAYTDDSIAMMSAILLFLVPAKDGSGAWRPLLDWAALLRTPWHILFLLGGGFALASAFQDTGLAEWVGNSLSGLAGTPLPILMILVTLTMTFLTEVTSNVATATVLLPVLGKLACSIGVDPGLLLLPAALAASNAFMLPMATPPNAIVFSSGRVTIATMAQTGLILNVFAAVVIAFWVLTMGRLVYSMGDAAAHCP